MKGEMMNKILEDFNWLKRYSGYPDKCATLEPVIRKATPMKVEEPYKQHDETLIGECPHCTAFVQSRNYCGHCGQKLDWSEDDE